MVRSLTTFHKALIAGILIMLAGGALLRLYFSYAVVNAPAVEIEHGREPEVIMVHVKGAVRTPGPVTLSPEARVRDAVTAAGGFIYGADRNAVNLAAHLTDGQELFIPGADPRRNHGSHTEKLAPGEKVNINSAGEPELERVPGIGPTFASRIVQLRARRGPFESIEQLMLVQGIGEWRFEQIKPYVSAGNND